MFQVQNLTADTRQKQNLVLPSGEIISLSIYFIPQQLGWFITNLTYQNFVLNGVRISNSPNMLYQFRNQIPFGLACVSTQKREPTQQEDFASGASLLYILSEAEVEAYTEFLSG